MSKITIGLLWHSVNSDNLGIGALTASHLAIISEVARRLHIDVKFLVLGWRDNRHPYIEWPGLECYAMRGRDLLRPDGLRRAARKCDLVLDISAGDSFADIYGVRQFLFNTLAKVAVLAAGRPLMLSPQTIGPFNRWWTRTIARLLLRRMRCVVSRDDLTTHYIRPFVAQDRLVEATDVAFRLPYVASREKADGKLHVGINVSGLLFNGGYSRNNMFALNVDYPALMRLIIRYFLDRADCSVHLVGHVNSERLAVEDDFRVALKLAKEFPGAVVAPRFRHPSEAKSYIATMNFFCGSRMHACIAAFSSGVPVVPIAYSRKFAGLFGSIGYHLIADCVTQSTDEASRTIMDAFARRDELKEMVLNGQKIAEAKLAAYEKVLEECLTEVASSQQ